MTTHVRYSNSVVLVWQVAELEARQLEAVTIEPTHLFLGLSKMVDLDLPALIPKELPRRDDVLEECLREVRRLRTVFHEVNLDAQQFRRRLRSRSRGRRFGILESGRLHRDEAAKMIFRYAEGFAQINQRLVFPIHLLCAVLKSQNLQWDSLLQEFGIRKTEFWQTAKCAMFSLQHSDVISQFQWN